MLLQLEKYHDKFKTESPKDDFGIIQKFSFFLTLPAQSNHWDIKKGEGVCHMDGYRYAFMLH